MSIKTRLFLKKLAEAKDKIESKHAKKEKERIKGMLEGINIVYSAIKTDISRKSKDIIEAKIDVLKRVL